MGLVDNHLLYKLPKRNKVESRRKTGEFKKKSGPESDKKVTSKYISGEWVENNHLQ